MQRGRDRKLMVRAGLHIYSPFATSLASGGHRALLHNVCTVQTSLCSVASFCFVRCALFELAGLRRDWFCLLGFSAGFGAAVDSDPKSSLGEKLRKHVSKKGAGNCTMREPWMMSAAAGQQLLQKRGGVKTDSGALVRNF